MGLTLSGCVPADQTQYLNATRQGTLGAYEQFVHDYPRSTYAPAAKSAISRKKWEAARNANTLEALEAYIRENPTSPYVSIARALVAKKMTWFDAQRAQQLSLAQETAWSDARQANTADAYSKYLAEYPTGKHAADAHSAMEKLRLTAENQRWNAAQTADTPQAYSEFLKACPASEHATEARRLMREAEEWMAGEREREAFFVELARASDPADIARQVSAPTAKRYITPKTLARLEGLLAQKLAPSAKEVLPVISASKSGNKGSVTLSSPTMETGEEHVGLMSFGGSEGRGDYLIRLKDGGVLRVRTELPTDAIPVRGTADFVNGAFQMPQPEIPDAAGSIHRFEGTVTLGSWRFVSEGDMMDRLTFVLTERGYVYIRGKGMVQTPDGKKVVLP